MELIVYYPLLKVLHVAFIGISGGLFFLRGLSILLEADWPYRPAVKYSSYAVDTVLLISGISLFLLLPATVFANGWLNIKLGMVVVYILLGVFAFRSLRLGKTVQGGLFYLLALLVFFGIVVTALRHQPVWMLS
ncbi:MAG: SirB2 family protein [Thiolinea sp.]